MKILGYEFGNKTVARSDSGRTSNHVAASRGRRAHIMPNRSTSPNTVVTDELATIQNRVRDSNRNNAYNKNALAKSVSNEIGSGIKPRFNIKDEALNEQITDLWKLSSRELVTDGINDFYAAQRLIARGRRESGEVFIRRRRRSSASSLAVPMQVQILESEFLDPKFDRELNNGNIIRAGIEINRSGDRVAYWFFKSHPNEKVNFGSSDNERVRILAKDVIHHYIPLRAGQLRGVPVNTASLFKAANLDIYDDFELERKKNKASFTGTIEKEAYRDSDGKLLDFTGNPYSEDAMDDAVPVRSGTIAELADGEKLHLADGDSGGEFYADYMRQQLMTIAADHGMPYEVMTGDWGAVNDRIVRAILNDYQREIEAVQEIHAIGQLYCPIQHWWTDAAVASGRINLPNYATMRNDYLKCDWIPQGWAYVHPLQDAQAAEKLMEIGLTTHDKEARKRQGDAKEIQRKNVAYREEQKRLEDKAGLTIEEQDESDKDSDKDI